MNIKAKLNLIAPWLALAQDFLDLLMLPTRKKIEARNLEGTKLRVAHEVLKLNGEVQAAFYTMQAHQQFISRLSVIVEVNEAAADVAQRQHDAGNINDLELRNQQAIYAQSRLDAAKTGAQVCSDQERQPSRAFPSHQLARHQRGQPRPNQRHGKLGVTAGHRRHQLDLHRDVAASKRDDLHRHARAVAVGRGANKQQRDALLARERGGLPFGSDRTIASGHLVSRHECCDGRLTANSFTKQLCSFEKAVGTQTN